MPPTGCDVIADTALTPKRPNRKKRDRRNLYLKDEGMILGNAADDAHVPEPDLAKRRAAHEDKKVG